MAAQKVHRLNQADARTFLAVVAQILPFLLLALLLEIPKLIVERLPAGESPRDALFTSSALPAAVVAAFVGETASLVGLLAQKVIFVHLLLAATSAVTVLLYMFALLMPSLLRNAHQAKVSAQQAGVESRVTIAGQFLVVGLLAVLVGLVIAFVALP